MMGHISVSRGEGQETFYDYFKASYRADHGAHQPAVEAACRLSDAGGASVSTLASNQEQSINRKIFAGASSVSCRPSEKSAIAYLHANACSCDCCC